jgi:hypothetical protein
MTPLGSQEDREIVLFELGAQLTHRKGSGIAGIRGLSRRCSVFELRPHFLLPLNLRLSEEITQLAGRPFPQPRGGIREICIAARSGRTFPGFALLAFHLEGRIVWFARISHHGVAHFPQSTGGNFGDRTGINSPLVCEGNRLDKHGVNLLELRLLFGSEVIPICQDGRRINGQREESETGEQQADAHEAPPCLY